MTTFPAGAPEQEGWEEREEEPLAFPSRPRRRVNGPATAVLLALLVGAVGFYVGIRVQKSQMSTSSAASGSGVSSRLAALAARGTTGSAAAGRASGAGSGGGVGFARAFGGAGGGTAQLARSARSTARRCT